MYSITKFLVGLGILLGSWLIDSPAYADGTGTAYVDGDGVTARVDDVDQGSPRSVSNSPSEIVCTTREVNPNMEGLFRVNDEGKLVALFDEAHKEDQGHWSRQTCIRRYAIVSERLFWVANVDAADLARQALATAPLPTPAIAISAQLPVVSLVNYPQWLWIDSSAWKTVTASASLDGLTATVTAVPAKVVWNSGDTQAADSERVISCNDSGKALPVNVGYLERMNGSSCTYYYRHTSGHESDLTFDLSATIQWNVTWTATNGTGGNLGVVSRSSAVPVKVGEYQVVNISPQKEASK